MLPECGVCRFLDTIAEPATFAFVLAKLFVMSTRASTENSANKGVVHKKSEAVRLAWGGDVVETLF